MDHTRRELLILSGLATGGVSGLTGSPALSPGTDPDGSEESTQPNTTADDPIADDSTVTEEQTVTELSIDFHDWSWINEFTESDITDHLELVTDEAYDDRSLRVDIPEGESDGASLHYWFAEESSEPEELWASYYLYFPESFEVTDQVGKLPGPAGTYGAGGWGGRQSDGRDGWSARMGFREINSDEIGLQYYVYHAGMDDEYGEFFIWDQSLWRGQWYRIDQYILLNDPEQANGVLMGWVDGEPAYDDRSIRFRTTPELRIEDYWFNVYWGGMYDSPRDNWILFDDLVVRTNGDVS